MATSITYKNNEISSFDSGTKILKTSGKYLEDDITVVSTPSEAAAAISITDEEDTHGGTIRHINAVSLAGDTVAPDKLLQGYTAHNSAGEAITGTYVGGSNETPAAHEGGVIFIDYDGTVLYEYTAAQFGALQSLPANPTHSGLTAQGWNWTMQEITTQLAATPEQDVIVGQLYVTDDGKTRLYVNFTDRTYLDINLIFYISASSTITIEWGDNTTTSFSQTNTTGSISKTHTYDTDGEYVVLLSITGGKFRFKGNSSNSIFGTGLNYGKHFRVTKIELGNNIDYIDEYAFNYCTTETITVPNNINFKSYYIFNNNEYLKSITIPRTTFVDTTQSTASMFANNRFLESISLPFNVTKFGNFMFSGCYRLKLCTFPINLTSIGNSSFASCYLLSYISLPSGLTSIGSSAFAYCYNLQSQIKIASTVSELASGSFQYCYNLADIIFENTGTGASLTTITSYAFGYNVSITSIALPSTINTIEGAAFRQAYALENITFLSNIAFSSNYQFYCCYRLKAVNTPLNGGITNLGSGYTFQNCYKLQEINLTSTVDTIPQYAFAYCYSLQRVNAPSAITNLGQYAFIYCYSLKTVNLSPNITAIPNYAFTNCSSLSLNFPTALETIGNYAFQGCQALTNVTFTNSLTTIGTYAFHGCISIAGAITIPSSVTSIGTYAFSQCKRITSIVFSTGLTTLPNNVCDGCGGLRYVSIPSSVTSIGSTAFQSCYSMEEYHLLPTIPPTITSTSFNQWNSSPCKIYVPYSADHSILEAYKTATNWAAMASRMIEEDPT